MLKVAVFLVATCLSQAFAAIEWLPDPVVINVNFDYCDCMKNVGGAIGSYENLLTQFFTEGNITHFSLIDYMKPKVQEMKEGKCNDEIWREEDAYQMSYSVLIYCGLFPMRRTYDPPQWHLMANESICHLISTQGPKMAERIKINLPIARTFDFKKAFDEGFYKNWKQCDDWSKQQSK